VDSAKFSQLTRVEGVSGPGRDHAEVSIVIVDGQDVVHAGIEASLRDADPPIKIIDNFSCPEDFMAVDPMATRAVDVVVFALQYEGHRPAFTALRELCRAGHRVVVHSYLVSDEVILTSLDAGAVSYVAKCEGGEHLREAIYGAGWDRRYVGPRMARALLNHKTVGRPHLSKREREVLVAWFETGNKELVAKKLFIEPCTVRTHLQRARAKYAAVGRPAPTKAALVARAIQDGILSAHDL
jgi:DNA-binding NarL/FixJ family response regulator